MEAPKCRLCEKRHYGTCAAPVVPKEPRARRKPVVLAKRPAPKNLTATQVKARMESHRPKKSSKAKVSESDRCGHGKQISSDLHAFCLLASGHAGDHEYMDSDGLFTVDEGRDVCPECGTNLAARDKERARRREYMRARRAAKTS